MGWGGVEGYRALGLATPQVLLYAPASFLFEGCSGCLLSCGPALRTHSPLWVFICWLCGCGQCPQGHTRIIVLDSYVIPGHVAFCP